MPTLLNMYQSYLLENEVVENVSNYLIHNQKKRLVQKYGDKISFHLQHERNKTELSASFNRLLSNATIQGDLSFVQQLLQLFSKRLAVVCLQLPQGTKERLLTEEVKHVLKSTVDILGKINNSRHCPASTDWCIGSHL